MSTSGFDSPLTPSKDMPETIEPTNDIFAFVNGTTIEPNIEFNKCNLIRLLNMLQNFVEVMVTIYNTILIIDSQNFLDILLVQLVGEIL
jgi:hypothetical protein